MKRTIGVGVVSTLIGGQLLPATLLAAEENHQFEVKARAIYWNDDSKTTPTSAATSYEQSALGLQLNYQSPHWGGFVGVDASAYGVAKIDDRGTPTTNLLEVGNDGQLKDSYATIGQALVKLKYNDLAQAKIGRQLQNSLLLKSTLTRTVPDTYSGASASVTPLAGLSVYGAVYDQWRARSTDEFEKFRTESTAVGVPRDIDYIRVLGATYSSGPVAVTAEHLNSKDYLSKFGLVGAYKIPFQKDSLKLSAGYFTSRDDGDLFRCGAERELDCTGTGRIENDGQGIYLDADYKVGSITLGAALAKFDGLWVEDNFAVNADRTSPTQALTQDHGTNPFPTSAGLGPDFTNNGETVAAMRLAYDWKDYIGGLTTSIKYVRGTGAERSNIASNARGTEHYREVDVRYAVPWVKNLSARYVYMNYDSKVEGAAGNQLIRGMPRVDWEQHRFYLDYAYKF